MKVGVVLPNGIPGVDGRQVVEWARRIDEGPFSAVAAADRLVYPNMDHALTLAAAAAVTERVLVASIVTLAPLRPTALFLKEVGTLATLAPGRFSLGVGIGARPYDYEAAGVAWERRGRILDDQLAALDGQRSPADPDQGLGPTAPPAEILVGGASAPALRRIVAHADGYISGGIAPEFFGYEAGAVRGAWAEAGKPGQPRLVAGAWFSSNECGPGTVDDAQGHMDHYMAKGGPPAFVRAPIYRGEDGVREAVEGFGEKGAEELWLTTTTADLAELDWLAGVVSRLPAAVAP